LLLLSSSLLLSSLSSCRQLLAGAAVNEKTQTGETALHLAAVRDNSQICSVLIENNIDVDAVDENQNNGKEPLLFFHNLVFILSLASLHSTISFIRTHIHSSTVASLKHRYLFRAKPVKGYCTF
jgi:ankyrin repeat protein